MHEEDGVLSIRSFELLVQWMYIGQVIFGDLSASESITTAIEFVRIADMFDITGMEVQMAEHIKALVLASPATRLEDSNTHLIDSDHIISAVHLHGEHPVRKLLVAASIRGYFLVDKHKFAKEARENLGFSSDLLEAVKDALKTSRKSKLGTYITDPLRGQEFALN